MKTIYVLAFVALIVGLGACKNSEKSNTSQVTSTQDETTLEKSKTDEAYSATSKPERQKAAPESIDDLQEYTINDDSALQEEERISNEQDPNQFKPFMADDSFFKMIKTPCYGRCPVYNFEVKQNGFAILEGIKFFDYTGMHEGQFTENQLDKIQALADEYGYLGMDNVYDAPVTDLPSTTTALRTRDGFHWVYNRMNAPQELSDFQMEIETLIKEVQWKPADQTTE